MLAMIYWAEIFIGMVPGGLVTGLSLHGFLRPGAHKHRDTSAMTEDEDLSRQPAIPLQAPLPNSGKPDRLRAENDTLRQQLGDLNTTHRAKARKLRKQPRKLQDHTSNCAIAIVLRANRLDERLISVTAMLIISALTYTRAEIFSQQLHELRPGDGRDGTNPKSIRRIHVN